MGVGQPAGVLLDMYAQVLRDAFGATPYHVGSSLLNKTGWRDVDVRVMLDDDAFDALMGDGLPLDYRTSPGRNRTLAAFNLAFSTLGREITGLPIDFQLQRLTQANEQNEGPRGALALRLPVSSEED